MVQIKVPDPAYTHSARSKRNFIFALRLAATVVAILWLVFLSDQLLGLELRQFGLYPRHVHGLLGVLTSPLIHANFSHIINNSVPLFVGLAAILYLYPNSAFRVLPVIYIGSGLLSWFYARPSFHIGASGLIYGILAYVFVSGLLRKDLRSVGVTMLIYFLYGSMIWGLLPIRERMSWELHFSGTFLGIVLAIVYRRWDHVPLKRYDWEDDDEVPDWYRELEDKSSRNKDSE